MVLGSRHQMCRGKSYSFVIPADGSAPHFVIRTEGFSPSTLCHPDRGLQPERRDLRFACGGLPRGLVKQLRVRAPHVVHIDRRGIVELPIKQLAQTDAADAVGAHRLDQCDILSRRT